jgi:putative aldouronate transport system substrate-binding protein
MNKRCTRRDFLRMTSITAGAAALAACAPATTTAPMSAVDPTATTAPLKAAEVTATTAATKVPYQWEMGVDLGSPNHARGWAVKYPNLPAAPADPPIKIMASRRAGTVKFAKNDDINNNPFTRLMQKQFGIEWTTTGTGFNAGDGDEMREKYNLAMAGGSLPDFMETVDSTVFANMLEAGMIEDITDAFEKEASQRIKDDLNRDNAVAWSYAKVNGRIMGFPYIELYAQNDKLLWIREDWLDKVGMKIPTTLDEVEAVALAFKQADLGKGEKGTTVGLLASNQLNTWYASLDPILGAFGVLTSDAGNITTPWVEKGGGLIYAPIQPEMKEALVLLQRWYKEGVIPADFDIKQPWEQQGLVAGNQTGMHFSPYFAAGYGALDSIKNDPEARWTFADIPSGPGGKKGRMFSIYVKPSVFAFRKGFPHVAEVIRMTNWMADLYQNPELRYWPGWEDYTYEWQPDDKITIGPVNAPHGWFYGPIGCAGNSGTDPLRDANRLNLIEEWMNLPAEKKDAAQEFATTDGTGVEILQRQAYLFASETAESNAIKNRFIALPTETMKEAGGDLYTLELTTMISIIKGERSVDAFDEFVTQWKAMGGDMVTDEVNAWWASKK